MKAGGRVLHARFGSGTIITADGVSAVVKFEHGIELCETTNLRFVASASEAFDRGEWDVPQEVVNRVQALAIRSANDAWGVFSRSRVQLLPHQLWVCRKVNESWPTRWLVADDVGLGKTVEAGMIVSSLMARGLVRRLLVLCPASLVDQWAYRFRTMFDIRLTKYSIDGDTAMSDFWGTHNQVVASLQTLRMKNPARRMRLTDSEPWDLVFVDEAHHLGADEQDGHTLGYRLVKDLEDRGRIRSMVFFTGTPHRGKEYAFLALLQLLHPDLFDPRRAASEQMKHLPGVMIRNNKATVTDLEGKRLFREPKVISETYSYSPPEARFYELLTRFIVDGHAYASNLDQVEQQAVMLVLIAMQKLASSSVAAIRRAIAGRLERVNVRRREIVALQKTLSDYREAEAADAMDEVSRVEEQLLILEVALNLMENEEPALRALLEAADAVTEETKIAKIIALVDSRFHGRSVLFFTEYKATQSMLMWALMTRFGESSVTFINGDNEALGVVRPSGAAGAIRVSREDAADGFNRGRYRFLVATEAGGEGIDLQENCNTLVHVDLPWNPMRLHQRVGRLNRYGQSRTVEVVTIRNPHTVESRIWDKLNEKLNRITAALSKVMDQPEDLLQLVLGMSSPAVFREVFSKAATVNTDSLGRWFDEKTASFGGEDVVQTVINLFGKASRFDFRQVSDRIPKVDLPDARPFLESALALNGRRAMDQGAGLSFNTPDAWQHDPAVRREYKGMRFDREDRSQDATKRLLGVGHPIFDHALRQAIDRAASVASLSVDELTKPLFVFAVRDRVTDRPEGSKTIVLGVELGDSGPELLRDWELLRRMNEIPWRRIYMSKPSPVPSGVADRAALAREAESYVQTRVPDLGESFRIPQVELCAALFPRALEVSDRDCADDTPATDSPVRADWTPAAETLELISDARLRETIAQVVADRPYKREI